MKKILTGILSLMMCLSMNFVVLAEDEGEKNVVDTVAKMNDNDYSSVTEAIKAVEENGTATINVIANTTEDITIPVGKTITLVISDGVTITNSTSHTITNNGTLTITGNGTIDNVTHAKGDLVNVYGAAATLSGSVSYTRSKEAGKDKNNSGGNSWYNIVNQGTMTIKDNTNVTSTGSFSSLIRNGELTNPTLSSTLTIESGTFSGGINTIKNGDFGYLYINGGAFSNTTQATVLNWHHAEISGGTFSPTDKASNALLVGKWIEYESNTVKYKTEGNTIISGGTFNGNISQYENSNSKSNYEHGTYTILGGTFSKDISEYLVDGYKVYNDGSAYKVISKDTSTVEVNENTVALDKEVTTKIADDGIEVIDNDFDKAQITTVDVKTKTIDLKKEEQTKVEEVLKLDEKEEITNILPIDITLTAVDSNGKKANLIKFNSDENEKGITVTVLLKSEDANKFTGKNISVVRIHDGEYEVIASDAKLVGNSLTFTSDKFSTYVLVAKEKTYTVSYNTVGDSKYGLPTTVVGTIPEITTYLEGNKVTVANALTTTETKASDGTQGTWSFSWDKEDFEIGEDTVITGTWKFTPIEVKPTATPTVEPTSTPTPTLKPTATPKTTATPSATSTPKATTTPTATPESKTAKTSDSSNVALYGCVTVIAVAAVGLLFFLKKRTNN